VEGEGVTPATFFIGETESWRRAGRPKPRTEPMAEAFKISHRPLLGRCSRLGSNPAQDTINIVHEMKSFGSCTMSNVLDVRLDVS
jgi:hypothetical protein